MANKYSASRIVQVTLRLLLAAALCAIARPASAQFVTGPKDAEMCLSGGRALVARTGGFEVRDAAGVPVIGCVGCEPATNNYKLKAAPGAPAGNNWMDVLRLVYAGLHHDGTTTLDGTKDCAGAVRRSLLDQYNELFEGGCAAGACPLGLQHAFRTSDGSAVSEVVIGLLGLPPVTATTSPFCNGFETEDNDPVRRACVTKTCTVGGQAFCDANGGGTCVNSQRVGEKVCAGNAEEDNVCSNDNKLGVVLPIFAPQKPDLDGDGLADAPTVAGYYDMATCPATNTLALQACHRIPVGGGGAFRLQCPDRPPGDGFNIAGGTLTPVGPGGIPCLCDTNASRCKSTFSRANVGQPYVDHRVFNLFVRRATGRIVVNRPPAAASSEIVTAFFRLRSSVTKPALERCALVDDSLNASCLATVSDCAIGYAKTPPFGHPATLKYELF